METRIGNECECGEGREIEERPGVWVCVACGTMAAVTLTIGSTTTFEEIEGDPPSTYFIIRESGGERRYMRGAGGWFVEAGLATQFPTIESARVARSWLSGFYNIYRVTVCAEVAE